VTEAGNTTSEHMVLSFLQAEIDSKSKFGLDYLAILNANHIDRSLVDQADLSNPDENRLRARLLTSKRGYLSRTALFLGFPASAGWRIVEIDISEYSILRHLKDPEWIEMSSSIRLVTETVRSVREGRVDNIHSRNINAVAERIRRGDTFPELIVVQRKTTDDLIVLEGNTRAAAYAVADYESTIRLVVGTSEDMDQWHWY